MNQDQEIETTQDKEFQVKMSITPSTKDTLYIPIGRGVSEFKIEGIKDKEIFKNVIVDGYENKYIYINIKPKESITILRKVLKYPPKPTIDPKKCLKNDERFCKWRENGYIKNIVTNGIKLSDRESVLKYVKIIKEIKYSYPRTNYEYCDDVVKEKLPQDCLGYHGTLCALLRCHGIPAVLDVGIRLTGNDKPHVWLWYFNREKSHWHIVDINDSLNMGVNTSRMSVTLGTTHIINSNTVSFVQYFVSEKRIEGLLEKPHNMNVEIFTC